MDKYSPITVARFWSKVDVKWSQRECWEWTGARRSGYGNIKIGGVSHTASRVAYEVFNRIELDGMALHTCDNKLCCNPTHIYSGTASENMVDMHKRIGRTYDKLKPQDVREIRKHLEDGIAPCDIAHAYNVGTGHIHGIKSGRVWAFVK